MNKRLWIFQYPTDVKKKGADKASWFVGWYDQDSKRHAESCGPGVRGNNKAEKRLRHLQSELDMGLHQPPNKKKWSDFRAEYDREILPNLAPQSQDQVAAALGHFERIMKPGRVNLITTETIDKFVAVRRTERGKKPKSTVAPATINKDLRHIKAALRIAVEWEFLPKMPRIRMVREPEKLVVYVTPEHFEKIYLEACPLAKLPKNPRQTFESCVWWEALLATAYMTGWRIGELLALRVEDVDWEAGTVITRHLDNKGKRDEKVKINSVIVEQLRLVVGHSQFVFEWTHDERALWTEFGRIQRAAGIHLTCLEEHEHTPSCHVYGFHGFRKGFATENYDTMPSAVLQKRMRHRSFTTTLGYINLGKQVEAAADRVKVPPVLRKPVEPKPTTAMTEPTPEPPSDTGPEAS